MTFSTTCPACLVRYGEYFGAYMTESFQIEHAQPLDKQVSIPRYKDCCTPRIDKMTVCLTPAGSIAAPYLIVLDRLQLAGPVRIQQDGHYTYFTYSLSFDINFTSTLWDKGFSDGRRGMWDDICSLEACWWCCSTPLCMCRLLIKVNDGAVSTRYAGHQAHDMRQEVVVSDAWCLWLWMLIELLSIMTHS